MQAKLVFAGRPPFCASIITDQQHHSITLHCLPCSLHHALHAWLVFLPCKGAMQKQSVTQTHSRVRKISEPIDHQSI
jgi:hypothetical protein